MLYSSIDSARKEYEEFLKSVNAGGMLSSNSARMEYIKSEIADMCAIAEQYKDKRQKLAAATDSSACEKLYGSKSVIPRGLYNPSPIIDKVLRDLQRGHLIKNIVSENDEYFEFIFNSNKQLIRADLYNDMPVKPYSSEYIIRKGDSEYGLTFHNAWDKINYLCKSVFKNGLVQSTMGFCHNSHDNSFSPASVMDIDSYEEYYYSAGKLIGACVYTISAVSYYYSMKEYAFFYNDDGEMSSRYTCRMTENGEMVTKEYYIDE